MKSICRYLLLLVFCLVLAGAQANGAETNGAPARNGPMKVLFIGNSLTFFNRMPDMVEYLAGHAPNPLDMEVDSQTAGGATMERHWMGGEALRKIRRGGWTHVVLQGQSAEALTDKEGLFKHIRLFDAEISKAGAKTLLFMTWALQKTPQDQRKITDAYNEIGREIGASVIPVGVARENLLELKPTAPFYRPDGKHPGPHGSYLAACLFYTMLSGHSPMGLPAGIPDARNAGKPLVNLSADDAALYQEIARRTAKAEAGKPLVQ